MYLKENWYLAGARVATDRNGSRKIDVRATSIRSSVLGGKNISAIANHRSIFKIEVFLQSE